MKTSELIGAALDWAVIKAIYPSADNGSFWLSFAVANKHSKDWNLSGPILTRERISRTIDHSGLWIAYWTDGYTEGDEGKKWIQCDRSELVAGLRCFVASKLGDEVDVPKELL